jgi:hypothetical protein
MIEIVISEISQTQQDETAYWLSNSANKSNLLKAITKVESLPFVDIDLENV